MATSVTMKILSLKQRGMRRKEVVCQQRKCLEDAPSKIFACLERFFGGWYQSSVPEKLEILHQFGTKHKGRGAFLETHVLPYWQTQISRKQFVA